MHVPDVFYIRLNGLELQTERILDPSLRNRPVAIISSYDSKGTIVSLSKEAEDDGLSYGMKISMAKRISQSTRFLPYNWPLYSKINQYILQTISDFTPTIEQNGFDGFYLDMKGIDILSGHIHNSGLSIFNRIQDKTSIISSVGISINKLISRTITSVVPEKVHNKISLKLKIPMIKKYRSLNLSTSVSILLSENLRQTKYLNGFRS